MVTLQAECRVRAANDTPVLPAAAGPGWCSLPRLRPIKNLSPGAGDQAWDQGQRDAWSETDFVKLWLVWREAARPATATSTAFFHIPQLVHLSSRAGNDPSRRLKFHNHNQLEPSPG